MIVLSKLKLEEIRELDVDEISLEGLADEKEAKRLAKDKIKDLLRGDSTINDNDLIGKINDSIDEAVENAKQHGNENKPNKKIDINIFTYDYGSGNSLLYIVVRDEGKGFNVKKPIVKNYQFGNQGLNVVDSNMDYVYNFNDSSVYMMKVIKRYFEDSERVVTITKDLTREKLGEEDYHHSFLYYSTGDFVHHKKQAIVHIFDLHALVEYGNFERDKVSPKKNAYIDFNPISDISEFRLRPYISVAMPHDDLESFMEDAKASDLSIEYRDKKSQFSAVIYPNSLFVSVNPAEDIGENKIFSYGLLPKFSNRKNELIQLYDNLNKDGLDRFFWPENTL
ncbi:hypothetical protein CL615_00950 [archaeon]|jgi:anti-sigma regulatory factor (Ser/Thr protein kinase)|nr:hypothetical protein [archaeon]MDP6547865.1 hypothetical protein [Candidatus Woesearchaeota archaeon]|tara:strand:- start:9565 stop:10575 length:1011 start_codon:yes stop_codon:yes gene_type:complete